MEEECVFWVEFLGERFFLGRVERRGEGRGGGRRGGEFFFFEGGLAVCGFGFFVEGRD